MIRPLVQSARCAARLSLSVPRIAIVRTAPRFTLRTQKAAPATSISSRRWYAASSGISQQEVEGRIMDLLKGFDKVKDASKLTAASHFSNDLGLDSLDTVEVVMAIEEEFSIEIPDKEADQIHSVDQAVKYIMGQPDAH